VSCQMKMMAALYLIPNRLQVLGKLICLIWV
jgi:hypothetical protein